MDEQCFAVALGVEGRYPIIEPHGISSFSVHPYGQYLFESRSMRLPKEDV